MYRSNSEAGFATYLRNHKIKFKYEPYKLKYAITLYRKYLPDFVFKDGAIIVEFKGWFTASDRKKMLAVRDANPEIDIRLVFEKDNYLSKHKKGRYSDWAKENGFKYHVGISLPKEWVEEFKK